MTDQILMFEPEPTTEETPDERMDGLLYNALYMFQWQIRRCQAGTWDAYSLPLLERGLATCKREYENGRTYGRFTVTVMMRLMVDARALITAQKRGAA